MAKETVTRVLRSLGQVVHGFHTDDRGQIAIIFGLSITGMMVATGAGLDLTRAYQARQMLYQVATMSCQYASRPSVVQMGNPSYVAPNGGPTYTSAVGGYIQAALASQTFPWTQSNATPFTYTANGPANVSLTASVPTAFMQIVNVLQLSVAATSHCYDSPSSITQKVPNGGSPYLIREGFEAMSNGEANYIRIVGRSNTTASTSFTQTPNYTGLNGTQWYSTGYCLETDQVGQISSTLPEGVRSVELDCDNSSNSAGNSATSAKIYLAVGNYELRYFYRGRVSYPNYDPVSICGSTASDVAWANDTNSSGGPVSNAFRTNQMNVYLDLNTTGSPPMHTTTDGSQQLAGANLIDVCVHAASWTERSVRIYVNTPGFYWVSFAADGQNDSFGAQLDNIRLCTETCPGTVADSFPTAWLPSGGVNKVLFQDGFEGTTYPEDTPKHGIAKGGNLNTSVGTVPGWPAQTPAGWATAPFNQVNFGVKGAVEGSQHILLDGYNSSGSLLRNRLVSRPFLLAPGYYAVSYKYISIVDFSPVGGYGTYCAAAPSAGAVFPNATSATGTIRYYNTKATDTSTNLIGAFLSHGSLVSTPITGGAYGSATSYTNPNGSVSTTPTVPPDAVSWTSYDPNVPNPVIDVCAYVDTYRWATRSASVKIQKTGLYWLTFSANGSTADGDGGGLDDIKLTALGSLSMTGAPTTALTTIPVPDPQPGSRANFTGFYTIADPLSVPAPLQ